jgi:hypothetical protein
VSAPVVEAGIAVAAGLEAESPGSLGDCPAVLSGLLVCGRVDAGGQLVLMAADPGGDPGEDADPDADGLGHGSGSLSGLRDQARLICSARLSRGIVTLALAACLAWQ